MTYGGRLPSNLADREIRVFQLDGAARFQQLTPELYAHYADLPTEPTPEPTDDEQKPETD